MQFDLGDEFVHLNLNACVVICNWCQQHKSALSRQHTRVCESISCFANNENLARFFTGERSNEGKAGVELSTHNSSERVANRLIEKVVRIETERIKSV